MKRQSDVTPDLLFRAPGFGIRDLGGTGLKFTIETDRGPGDYLLEMADVERLKLWLPNRIGKLDPKNNNRRWVGHRARRERVA